MLIPNNIAPNKNFLSMFLLLYKFTFDILKANDWNTNTDFCLDKCTILKPDQINNIDFRSLSSAILSHTK